MAINAASRTRRILWIAASVLGAMSLSCSPGTLPGAPSRVEFGGGGGRYDGRISYRRLGGNFILDESLQEMTLSLQLTTSDQFSASFRSPNSQGTLVGTLNGALNNGTFRATVLVSVNATQGTASSPGSPLASHGGAHACEGRGEAAGTFSGPNLTWTIGSITYTNCPGLTTSSQADARAVSPVPAPQPLRANVVITIGPSTTIRRGTCFDGSSGFPFVAEVAETAGVSVTFDRTIIVEERREGSPTVQTSQLDNPLTTLPGGERRRFAGCGTAPGTYQAFLTGRDANGNAVRAAAPLLTFVD